MNCPAQLSQEEVAAIMTARGYPMGRGRVHQIEKTALEKLRADPILRMFFENLGTVMRKRKERNRR